jgi:hypothetical protein
LDVILHQQGAYDVLKGNLKGWEILARLSGYCQGKGNTAGYVLQKPEYHEIYD